MNYSQKAVYGTCIPEEELPARVGLRVERKSDPDYGLSEDEIADRNEFIRCYLVREFELLMMLPGNDGRQLISSFPTAMSQMKLTAHSTPLTSRIP